MPSKAIEEGSGTAAITLKSKLTVPVAPQKSITVKESPDATKH